MPGDASIGPLTRSPTVAGGMQIEADHKSSSLEGGRQKALVDKIVKAQRFDAAVLWRLRIQRLELGRCDLAVE